MPEQQKLIEDFQPYNTPGLKWADLPYNFNRGLGTLNDWARKDRHRGLHVVAFWASDVRPLLEVPRGTRIDLFVLNVHRGDRRASGAGP